MHYSDRTDWIIETPADVTETVNLGVRGKIPLSLEDGRSYLLC